MRLYNHLKPVLVILALAISVVGCDNGPGSAQTRIDKLAREMKPQLPKMLDSDTKLVNVYTSELELVSQYELLNYPEEESERTERKGSIALYLKNKVCRDIKPALLSKGVSSRYIYKSENGENILELVLKPGDC